MYKYGVISTASIVKRFIDGVKLAGDEIVCIGSRDIDKAVKFAKDNSIEKHYGSYKQVYEDKDVDIVYVPVINSLHYECAKQALLHKKHVVLEKPFTTRVEDTIDLYRIARENNCFLFEGVKNIFVPSTKFVIDNLEYLGDIKTIETAQGVKVPFPKGHWMYDVSKGGGALHGSFAYVFHYLRYIFKSEIENLDGTFIPSENADLTCTFTFNINNIKVTSTIDCAKELHSSCIIEGSKGKMIIHEFWRSHNVEVLLNDGKKYEYKDEGNEFVYEAKHIQECIKNGLIQSPIIKDEDSIAETKNIEYLYSKWKLQ